MSASSEGGLDQQISMAQAEDHFVGSAGRMAQVEQAEAAKHIGIKPDEILAAAHEVESAFGKGTRTFVALAGNEYVGPIKHVKGDWAFQQTASNQIVAHKISELASDKNSFASLGEAVLNRSLLSIQYNEKREVQFSERSLQVKLSHAKERDVEF